jgi:NAD(P)-dependent dehydrogenase (short-subunit alcohol dehydrogenase family)
MSSSSTRTTLVVGANRGIGLALCKRFKALGRQVIAAGRRSSPALDALGARVELGVDVTSDEGVAALAQRLDGVVLDELVCNAGILREDALDSVDLDDVRAQLEVNALGPLRVVKALRRNIRRGGKLALITSRMGSIADNGSGGYYGYRMSKAALNAAGMSLARDLSGAGIAVAILHPGYVRTDMTEGSGTIDPDAAAKQLVDRIDAVSLETTGTFWHANGQVLPW